MPELFKMKEMMEQFEISEDTLRYYEKMELLPPVTRLSNGHRRYTQVHQEALRMIQCLKKTGMSLQELKPILHLQLETTDSGKNNEWRQILTDYHHKIERQQQELQFIKDMIEMKLQTGKQFGKLS
ncbi:MerR family transcriptional regulator [Paenibacillus illinoisensis]|uniref:MerR family transcriptional regulator n=1 Tax=Paenibacillus illinoisensis TaxID=59845 RepID=UPI003A4D77AB